MVPVIATDIEGWLDDIFSGDFASEHFQRAPFARAGTAQAAMPLLTWETVAGLIDAGSKPDMLVVRNATLYDVAPGTQEAAAELFRRGCSLVLRRCERHDRGFRMLADAFAERLQGDVSIQVYATPAGYQSFGWHYDCEDVFIAQTAGTKEYFLRENTVNPRPRLSAMPRDMHFERETSPAMASTLVPGDTLYIPRGWWHVARAREDAFSISVGVLSPDAR
jgi:ribosomal protein L16 Arg81 hydroxylase